MTLPKNLLISQSALQDYMDCPRRFELRHLQHLQWPALQSEPVLEQEHRMEMGQQFHQMVQQHQMGLDPSQVSSIQYGADVDLWWNNYLHSDILAKLPRQRYVEYPLIAPFAGSRMMAKYDLLAVDPGKRLVILDWKTSHKRPSLDRLKSRMQSRLYPYLLTLAGAQINHQQNPLPEQVEMIYWFTEYPGQPAIFQYSLQQYKADLDLFLLMVKEIEGLQPDEFPLTPDVKNCQFCVYRSLCNRGTRAGNADEIEEDDSGDTDSLLDINLNQIGEIEI